MLADTHAHLDDPAFDQDLHEVLQRAEAAGVDRVLVVGMDASSSLKAVRLAHAYDIVYAAVGVHPHRAMEFEREAEELQKLLTERKVVAVGEIGLDYLRGAPREEQLYAFRTQLDWSARHGLPASVHNREADNDVLDALAASGARAVLHCFSGGPGVARRGVDAGCMISFAGNVTFPRATAIRDSAAWVPDERLLLETDAPVLAPQTVRGRRNEPANVRQVAETIAACRGVAVEHLAQQAARNADRVFGWREV